MTPVARILPFVVLLGACGPDSELVASGKAHACNLKKAAAELEKGPENADLQKKVKEHADLLKAVIDTADEGKRADLEAAIKAAVEKGC